jgi:hypothetical protein
MGALGGEGSGRGLFLDGLRAATPFLHLPWARRPQAGMYNMLLVCLHVVHPAGPLVPPRAFPPPEITLGLQHSRFSSTGRASALGASCTPR